MAKTGERTEKITINQFVVDGEDSFGKPTGTITPFVANIWAKVEDGFSSESVAQKQVVATGSYTITIVWLDGITEDMSIEWREKTLHISGIKSDRIAREVIIECKEKRG